MLQCLHRPRRPREGNFSRKQGCRAIGEILASPSRDSTHRIGASAKGEGAEGVAICGFSFVFPYVIMITLKIVGRNGDRDKGTVIACVMLFFMMFRIVVFAARPTCVSM